MEKGQHQFRNGGRVGITPLPQNKTLVIKLRASSNPRLTLRQKWLLAYLKNTKQLVQELPNTNVTHQISAPHTIRWQSGIVK